MEKSENQQTSGDSALQNLDPKMEKQAPEDLQAVTQPAPVKQTAKPAVKPPAKVTAPASKKVKNPKRVAAGKALAAKNKERLAKIKALEESEKVKALQKTQLESEVDSVTQNQSDNWSVSIPLIVGGVVIVGGLTAIGYQKFAASNPPPAPPPSPAKQPPKKSNPFDDF